MWRPLLVVAILTLATDARDMRSKRATYTDLDAFSFNNYKGQFGSTLAHILGSEYNETKPHAAKLRADMEVCKTLITAKQDVCKSCAKDKCEPGLDDIIVYYLEEAAQPFVDFGNLIGDWSGWDDMGDFFEGAGKDFITWSGWDDIGNFFENIGKGIGGWSGWDDIGDFFVDFGKGFAEGFTDFWDGIGDFLGRRKRSLMLNGAGNEKLAHLYRALTKAYSRQSEISSEARACMEKCDSCDPFLADTDTLINTICGEELLQLNASYFLTITKLQLVYKLLSDKEDHILTYLKYDATSFDPTITGYARIKLGLKFAEGYRDFEPTDGYRLMAVPECAALNAWEYWNEV